MKTCINSAEGGRVKPINPTPMTTPKYQKIPGEKLTVDQFQAVQDSLMMKFGYVLPFWATGKDFYFTADGGRFLEVWG